MDLAIGPIPLLVWVAVRGIVGEGVIASTIDKALFHCTRQVVGAVEGLASGLGCDVFHPGSQLLTRDELVVQDLVHGGVSTRLSAKAIRLSRRQHAGGAAGVV